MTYNVFDNRLQLPEALADGFGRLRISEPAPTFYSQFQYDKAPELWAEKVVGSGSISHVPLEAAVRLQVGTASGDRAVRQTKQYFRYYPSRTQLVYCQGILGAPKPGVQVNVGPHDDANGIFLRQDGSQGLCIVVRSSVSGSVAEAAIPQAQWNLDRLDGSGGAGNPSRITLDPSKINIYIIDFHWIGRVRVGIYTDGRWLYCHQVLNVNRFTVPYVATPHLPVRWEIKNTAPTASSSAIRQHVSVVMSEGGTKEGGFLRSAGMTTARAVGSAGYTPLISFRLKTAMIRASFNPLRYSVLNTSANYARIAMFYGPTLTNPTWTSASEAIEIDVSASAMSGGISALEDYTDTKAAGAVLSNTGENLFAIAADIDGTADVFTIAGQAVGGAANASLLASMTWREIR